MCSAQKVRLGFGQSGVKIMQAFEQASNMFVAIAAQFLVVGVILTF
jgi:hypothetical protein